MSSDSFSVVFAGSSSVGLFLKAYFLKRVRRTTLRFMRVSEFGEVFLVECCCVLISVGVLSGSSGVWSASSFILCA